jgi:hypothetical protein
LLHLGVVQQTFRGLLQRGVMRDGAQLQRCGQFRHIRQQRDDAAIVLLLMRLKHQEREELMLSKAVRAEAM